MNAIHRLVVRDDSSSNATLSPTVINLLIALLVLVFFCLCLATGLYILRQNLKSKKDQPVLPLHKPSESKTSNHRRLTISTTPYGRRAESIYVYNEKDTLVDGVSSRPDSPIPEIRITFPEEEDAAGKRMSGRVVIVRIGETGVGLEPYHEDNLPPYQKSDAERFQSLDLERMGGLKEKEMEHRWV